MDQQQYVLCNAFAFQHSWMSSSQSERPNDDSTNVHKLLFSYIKPKTLQSWKHTFHDAFHDAFLWRCLGDDFRVDSFRDTPQVPLSVTLFHDNV